MWDSIVGHALISSILRRAARLDRVGHAYLFMGQRGVGKYTVAKAFATHVLCPAKTPCGVCESCRLMASGVHPDLTEIEPQGNTFRINQIRELNNLCLLRPGLGQRRVYILHNVEKLTADAANSFLRTLEEPPEHVTFILLADTQDVLATLVSRCQVFRFPNLSYRDSAAVVTGAGIPYETAAKLLKQSMGSPGMALDMLSASQQRAIAMADELAEMWPRLTAEDKLKWFKRLEGARDELPTVVERLTMWARDVVFCKLSLTELVAVEQLTDTQKQADEKDLDALVGRWQALASLQLKMRSNVNRKLVIDELLLV